MPFTISHAVIAPPIAKLTGNRLPIAGLAIGSMTPDLYRLFTLAESDFSHHWSGIFIPNLMIGYGFCLFWYLLYRKFLFRFVGMSKPLEFNHSGSKIGFLLRLSLALLIGIATHLIWDGLTHADFRTFAFSGFLSQDISLMGHIYPMHRVLQIGTSALALPFIAWMGIHYYRSYRVVEPIPAKIYGYALALLALSLIAGVMGYQQLVQTLDAPISELDLYWFTGKAINHFSRYFLTVFSLGGLLFLVLDRRGCFATTPTTISKC